MTPYELIQTMVEQYRSGSLNRDAFLKSLEDVDRFVQGFSQQLRAAEPAIPNAESESLKKLGEACFGKFSEAVAQLRKAAETQDMALCDAALQVAAQGDFLVNEILTRTAS